MPSEKPYKCGKACCDDDSGRGAWVVYGVGIDDEAIPADDITHAGYLRDRLNAAFAAGEKSAADDVRLLRNVCKRLMDVLDSVSGHDFTISDDESDAMEAAHTALSATARWEGR